LSPFTKPPALKQPADRVAPRKKAEQPSVLNSDVSGPITAVLSPVLKVILPLLPVLGWLGRLKRWQAWLLGVTAAFVALVVVANLEYDPKQDQGNREHIRALVNMCSESARAREYWTVDERLAWTRRCVSRIQGGASIPSVLTTD
jgi:hypothetical protein